VILGGGTGGPEDRRSLLFQDFSKTHCINPAVNGYPTLFRPGEGKGKKEEWHPTSVTPLPVLVRSLNGQFPTKPSVRGMTYTLSMPLTHPVQIVASPYPPLCRFS